ncbi:MAG: ATP-binding protein [Candidatus Omnitrophota bacterium]
MRANLQHKITFVFVIIFTFILLGTYLYINENLRKQTYRRIKYTLLKEATLVQTILNKHPGRDYFLGSLDEVANQIGQDLSLRVTIIALNGVVLGDSELDSKAVAGVENHFLRPEVQQALSAGTGKSERFSATVGKNMLYIAKTFGMPEVKGIVRLSIPLSEIELVTNRLKKILIFAFLLAFILTLGISFLASNFISKPIQEVAWVARSIAKGDFSKRITASSNDEIGDLAKAFNYMSEQIKAEIEEVTSNKLRLEAVFLSMFEGVMIIDSQGGISLINQTLKDLFHIEKSVNKRPVEVIRNVEIQEIVDRALTLSAGVETREISLLIPEEKILLIHATPVIREQKVDGAVLVFHDITNLRRLEKIRQDFVANVSHELRTPITSIRGYSETLLEGAIDDKNNARDFVKIIFNDSQRLIRLVDDLLDLSRIESGKLKINLKACSIKPIVERAVAALNKQIKEKSITFQIDIPDDVPSVLADETQIVQVLLNLADNANKYNCQNGKVTISAREKGKFVQVNVSDTGIGIPENDLPRVFERFYRVDKGRSRELGGTGLGLSIVKHIVGSHNGEVSVQSIVGKGSIFTFTLPKAETS